ncbi:MAG: hypothetical protein QXM08_00445 [Thermofilaceae archaeon]
MARARETGQRLVYILALLAFGAIATLGLAHYGYINPATVGKYGVWVIVGLLALYLISTQTKNPWDNIIAGFLLLLSIGGIGAVWMIDHGMVTEGAILLGSLFLVFIFLLATYARQPVLKK